MAQAWKFSVVFPQQRRANNPSRCFNWFNAADQGRGGGEALSIKQMDDAMRADHRVDPARIYVTGLSAGGAMTAVMLAAYPDVFAGGAPIAGLPHKGADNDEEAIICGQPGVNLSAHEWGDKVRATTSWTGPWPKVSIWQGTLDPLVSPVNAHEPMQQWSDVVGVDQVPDVTHRARPPSPSLPRQHRRGRGGDVLHHRAGSRPTTRSRKRRGPVWRARHIVDVNICASYYIGRFWGISGAHRSSRRP